MRQAIVRAVASLLAIHGATAGARAGDCASQADVAALQTAALQQELMVAAFSCHDIDLYNRFVTSHQPELIGSDARLKAFFVHRDARHSEAGYHAYKTELANASSLRSIRQTDEFCDGADAEFSLADRTTALSDVVGTQPIAASYPVCPGAAPLMQTAAVLSARHHELSDRPARQEASDEDVRRAPRHDADRADGRGEPADADSDRMSSDRSAPAPHREIDADSAL